MTATLHAWWSVTWGAWVGFDEEWCFGDAEFLFVALAAFRRTENKIALSFLL